MATTGSAVDTRSAVTFRTVGLVLALGVAASTMDGFSTDGVCMLPCGATGGVSQGIRDGGTPMSTPADIVTSAAAAIPALAGHGSAPNHGKTRV
ncbi:MAG: hypothetical protein HY829_08010 [Actinobacteria bacterium]|nr:hypothetical protein [Actinomycetota bacterium]